MKSIFAPLILAIVLAAAGAGFYMAGQTEKRLADVHNELATLQYTSASSDSERVETDLGAARRVPQVGPAAAADLRDARAVAAYWSGGYGTIAPQKDANGTVTETDPEILFLAANAAFRSSQSDDRAATLRKLDTVVKNYGDVLRNSPGHVDAAYNYEYAIRVRDMLAKAKPTPAAKNAKAQPKPAAAEVAGDLPAGPTLHGRPGGPPPATDMAQFKIVIPKRGEERKENPEAGKGGVKVRKG
ncbi:MAG TPA: hypothetical protein VFA27_09525 [Vicinamibacterales bacterium]|nr:hypothetical protein [Vicinamibacterales bacterium]